MDTGHLEINGSVESKWIMDLLNCYAKEYQEDVRSGKATTAMANNRLILRNVKNRRQPGPLVQSPETPSKNPLASPLDPKSKTVLLPKLLGGKF